MRGALQPRASDHLVVAIFHPVLPAILDVPETGLSSHFVTGTYSVPLRFVRVERLPIPAVMKSSLVRSGSFGHSRKARRAKLKPRTASCTSEYILHIFPGPPMHKSPKLSRALGELVEAVQNHIEI